MTKISTNPSAFRVRPAQPEEAGAFFAQTPEQNAQMGAIGHVRMDFGKHGTAFWHTWHPRGREELNSPEFKAELQQVVDKLRETVLKDFSSMRRFCYENGGKIPGGWSQNYGYVVETEHYEYCLRCNPVPGDYQAYLSCYDLNEQKINHDTASLLYVLKNCVLDEVGYNYSGIRVQLRQEQEEAQKQSPRMDEMTL